jgi:type II secretory pathway predicted ATPase ExeA/cell division protein FtsN
MEGEGFSVITGESGVGKTTVCRSFLERLSQKVVAAYIAAMTGLGPLQLLKAINAEFKVHSDTDTIKDLTDALNAFLIQKKREGRKVALFIDDAQLLTTAALEQVRLLSNLETTRDKLLQIILIGRPALSRMLGAPSLRQIGQRVSVNYFISPFDYEETVTYIQHRISISSAGPPVRFDQAAIRPIYQFTKGIPRKINIACDRILTAAYKYRERIITKKTVKDVLRQWHKGPAPSLIYLYRQKLPVIAIAGVLMLVAIASSMYLFGGKKTKSPTLVIEPHSGRPAPPIPSQSPTVATEAEPVATTAPAEKAPPAETARKNSAAEGVQTAPRTPLQPPLQTAEAEPAAATAPAEKAPPAETAQKNSAAEDVQTAPRTPLQPPLQTAEAEPAAATAPAEKASPAETAQKNSAAAADKSPFLAMLDSLRSQHNMDQVETTTAVGSEPSAESTYSIQVGAFLLAINAQQRANQLKSKGYAPRIMAVTDPQGRIWFSVRIGNFPTLEQAQKQADEFTAREKKASAVRPYNLY